MAVGLYESAGDWVFAYNEMNKKILPTVKMNLKFWPAILFFIYAYVPIFYRSICDAVFGAIWSIILSWVLHKNHSK